MKRHLITSALPYINGVKHLGNLIGSILPADVYSRYLRQLQEDVIFICGTDEHGTPAELAASEAQLSIEDYCEKMHFKQKEVFERFNIKFDYFGRTSSNTHKELTKEIFLLLEKNNFISEKEIKQFYSKLDKRFLPDRYVIGTCPYCNYEKARGDQCESCGKLLDTTQLISPYSAISGSNDLEIRSSRHLFFELQELQDKLSNWINLHPKWPNTTKGIALKWLHEGLNPRCISRDLKWGVSIPKVGYEDKVFYVWFDAPIAYISFTKEWACSNDNKDLWKSWWFDDNNEINYVQFMGKDNVPFHAIFFPAMLIGTNLNWKMVDYIKGFNWLTYEHGKFSTSSKRGVFIDQALELFPADFWRYYLLANIPENSDSDFNFKDFQSVINKDLADILGNLLSRVTALIRKYFNNIVPVINEKNNEDINKISHLMQIYIEEIDENFKNLKFREVIKTIRKIWSYGNEYIALSKPWEFVKHDTIKGGQILANAIYILKISAIASSPFIPTIAKEILTTIGEKLDLEFVHAKNYLNYLNINNENRLSSIHSVLIKKIEDNEIELLQNRFKGTN